MYAFILRDGNESALHSQPAACSSATWTHILRTQQPRRHSSRRAPCRWQDTYLKLTSDSSIGITLMLTRRVRGPVKKAGPTAPNPLTDVYLRACGSGYCIRGKQNSWPFPILTQWNNLLMEFFVGVFSQDKVMFCLNLLSTLLRVKNFFVFFSICK